MVFCPVQCLDFAVYSTLLYLESAGRSARRLFRPARTHSAARKLRHHLRLILAVLSGCVRLRDILGTNQEVVIPESSGIRIPTKKHLQNLQNLQALLFFVIQQAILTRIYFAESRSCSSRQENMTRSLMMSSGNTWPVRSGEAGSCAWILRATDFGLWVA